MLSQFDGKQIRVTARDGEVFEGVAEAYPSGYGLQEFGVEEESLEIGGTTVFASEIAMIEDLSAPKPEAPSDRLIGDLINGSYRIIDLLPMQVPKDADGQYFAVERCFLKSDRLAALRRKQADLLLCLNCYTAMTVSLDGGETWTLNPDPEALAASLEGLACGAFLRAVFPAWSAMIDVEPEETWMTAYGEHPAMLDLLRPLVSAAGLFLWPPKTDF